MYSRLSRFTAKKLELAKQVQQQGAQRPLRPTPVGIAGLFIIVAQTRKAPHFRPDPSSHADQSAKQSANQSANLSALRSPSSASYWPSVIRFIRSFISLFSSSSLFPYSSYSHHISHILRNIVNFKSSLSFLSHYPFSPLPSTFPTGGNHFFLGDE